MTSQQPIPQPMGATSTQPSAEPDAEPEGEPDTGAEPESRADPARHRGRLTPRPSAAGVRRHG